MLASQRALLAKIFRSDSDNIAGGCRLREPPFLKVRLMLPWGDWAWRQMGYCVAGGHTPRDNQKKTRPRD